MIKDPKWGDLAPNVSQEFLFDMWAAEAIRGGWIIQNKKPTDPFVLAEDVNHTTESEITIYKGQKREQQKKVYSKVTLMTGCTYGCDRVIQWANKSQGVLFSDINVWKTGSKEYFKAHKINGTWWTWLDVKSPVPNVNQSDVSFSIKRKWVWQKYKIYVNKVICYPVKKKKNISLYLWPSTFTPSRYFWTDKLTKLRTIRNWKPKSIKEWMK